MSLSLLQPNKTPPFDYRYQIFIIPLNMRDGNLSILNKYIHHYRKSPFLK
jgi:hypothetical protein